MKNNIASRLLALLKLPDNNPGNWTSIFKGLEINDLPVLVRIKAAVTEAIDEILKRSE